MASESGDRRRQRIAAVVLVVVVALIAGGIAWTAMSRSGGGATTAAAPTPSAAAPAEPQAVVLVAVTTPQDDFTPPMGEDAEITAIAAESPTGLTDVKGNEVGLYGGTLELGSCDRDQLAAYLEEHPTKAEAWAAVRGVPVSDIRAHLSRLTPLILRTDTLVTNHGYVDGVADAFPSVLQAGTAVLVDDYGVPAVRCYCGNPLTAAPDLGPGTTFEGKEWKGWKPERTVRIKPATDVIDNFTVVDTATDSLFTRPAGTGGTQDTDTGEPAPAGIAGVVVDPGPLSGATAPAASAAPAEPAASTAATEPAASAAPSAPSGERPPGEPVVLFEVTSIAGVSSGPPEPTVFTLDSPAYLTTIFTYHYFNEGAPPGTIGLQAEDGTVYGPWPATGTEGQGGVPNANWFATPNTTVPAGTYTIIDSDPDTWSWTLDTDRRGIAIVEGIPVVAG
jgi:hypothetical protein